MLDEDGQTLANVRGVGLNTTHLSDISSKIVFDAIMELSGSGRPYNHLTVAELLQQRGMLARIGGATGTDTMVDEACHAPHAEWHAVNIYRAALSRQGAQVCQEYQARLTGNTEPEKTLADLQGAIADLQGKGKTVAIRHVAEYREEKVAQWNEALWRGFIGIPSTISPEINTALGGYRQGVMTILGGYRGEGKSTLARQEALGLSVKGYRVLLCTMEDPGDIAAAGIAGNYASHSVFQMDTGKARPEDVLEVDANWKNLDKFPLRIVSGGMRIEDIESAAALCQARYGLDFIVVDHIQFIIPYVLPRLDRNGTVGTYSQRIVAMLHRHKIPGLVLSQLSREAEKGDRKPRLSDLRDSGCIEQDCRQAFLLYGDPDAPRKDDEGKREWSHILELAKNNNGKSGVSWQVLRVDGRQRFELIREIVK